MASQFILAFMQRVSPAVQFAGAGLWRGGKARIMDLDADSGSMVVRDGSDWVVHLQGYDHPTRMLCACPCRTARSADVCRHGWAALLEIDRALTELDAAAAAIDVGMAASVPSRRRLRLVDPSTPRQLGWRQRVELLMQPVEQRPASVPVVQYLVQPGELGDDTGMTVHLHARAVKKNGELGVPRTVSLTREQRQRLASADQALLSMWDRDRQHARGRYSYYYAAPGASREDGWVIARAAMPLVVPLLAATGRAFLGAPWSVDTMTPLRIDVAEPFCFEIDYQQPTSSGGDGCVVGVLRRGAERLDNVPTAAVTAGDCYVFVGDRLVRADYAGAESLALELAQRGPMAVPAAEAGELLGALARLKGARQFLARAVEHVPAHEPIGVLALLLPTATAAPVTATLQFDYGGTSVERGDEDLLVTIGDAVHRRDFAAEQRLAAAVLACGVRTNAAGRLECDRAQVPTVTAALCAAGVRVLAQGKLLRSFRDASSSVRSGLDWFEVGSEVRFEGRTAGLPELLRRKVTPEGFVELGDSSFGLLPDHWLRRIEGLRLLGGEVDGETVRVVNSQALLLDAMLATRDGEQVAVDAKFEQLRARLRSFASVTPVAEPEHFVGELRPYQRHGLGWLCFLRDFRLGGCLADDMGLGKTVQVLAHLAGEYLRGRSHRRRRGARPTLLVAPRSVLSNWLAEAARFVPQLRVLDFSGPDRWQTTTPAQLAGFDLVLTTYALLRVDAVKFDEHEMRFHYAILDESQVAKNADSQTSKAARLLRAEHRLALTGTPVENHLGELWSLFEFLNPGMLGRLPAFRGLFGGDMTTAAMAEHRDSVQRALRPVLLRRTKAQVLTDLPEKVEQTLWCELEPAQRRRYDQLRDHYRVQLLEGSGSGALGSDQRFVVLEALLRLRQAACHEGLLDPTLRAATSAKLEELLPRLEQLAAEGHRALVFSQFTAFLDLVEAELVQRGIAFERLDGSTRNRAARVQRFQEDASCTVFLISLKAGGFGLNLTAADYVFVLDPWWNPAAEMQAIDRAHRIGQKRTVHAYRLVCRNTVEERVLELQAEKKALCEAILGNERSLLQDMTRDDLALLLG